MLNKAIYFKYRFIMDGAIPEHIQDLADATLSTIKIYDVITKTHIKYK